MITLSKEQIIQLHQEIIEETGGVSGIKDEGLLESALFAPFQSFDGKDLFPSVYQKAARLGYGIASDHPFIDGNKRTGAHVMLIFLSLNRIDLIYTQEELSNMFLGISDGSETYIDLLRWILLHSS